MAHSGRLSSAYLSTCSPYSADVVSRIDALAHSPHSTQRSKQVGEHQRGSQPAEDKASKHGTYHSKIGHPLKVK